MAKDRDAKTTEQTVEKLLTRARQARRDERYADARQDLLRAIDLSQKAGVRESLARALAMLGQVERDQARLDSALAHYEQALSIFRELGRSGSVAHTVRHVGDIQTERGELQLAEACYQEALTRYRSHPQTRPLDLANAIRGFAILKSEMNLPDEAKSLWQEARELYDEVKVQEGVAECDQRIAELGSGI